MSNLSTVQQISLYSQKGGSDKVYQLQIDEVDGGYNIVYANGRRGQTLKPKVKNPTPLTLVAAEKEFTKIVNSKKNGSSKYQESDDDGSTLIATENANKASGIDLQLLNPIDEIEALRLCNDPAWVAQEKHDGERRAIQVKTGSIEGINKKGDYCGLVADIANTVDLSIAMVVDTEDLRTHAAAFDLLEYDGQDLRNLCFLDRYSKLSEIAKHSPGLQVSPIAVTTEEKLALLGKIQDESREGIVFKRADAKYIFGKPSSGGDQLKFKLYDEVSVIVIKQNAKQSVQIAVIDNDGNQVPVGNVTIPANAEMPSAGDVIEVRYLYAYKNGSLYQPCFEKPRNDVDPCECLQSRLKYKPEAP